jgi:hypothetical protein
VWLTQDEREDWKRAAKMTGFSTLSEWIRVHMREVVREIDTANTEDT